MVTAKHSTLYMPDEKYCPVNKSALYKCLFSTTFEAHDALENVIALQKIIFLSKLELIEEIVTNNKLISFSNETGDGAITRSRAEKIAGRGLSYEDFIKLFATFGMEGLVAILSKPPTTIKQFHRRRMTNTARKSLYNGP